VIRCRSCGHDNADAVRFCERCGTPLPDAGEARERKLVTVLFCDLVDFTARFDRADPEDVKAALSPYHALVRREIERFGGTVEKFIGDAVVGVYGAPVAHEDDARRALWSALRIPPAIEDLNESEPDIELAVRIGIDTGQAVVSLEPVAGQGIVTGDVANTASRIQAIAPVGGVIVGEATHRLTEDVFEFERMEPVRVKGKSRPLHLWRARGARSRFGMEPERPAATPFIGREDELEVLKRTFARTASTPSVQLVTLVGEPGVGKTRLVREFFSYIDDLTELVVWRQGRCLPYGEGVTFWALGEIVKAQAGILESDGPAEASAHLSSAVAALTPDEAEREWLIGRLAPLVGLPGHEGTVDRSESFSAWRRFLESMASSLPLVVVVEDLHWADPALLEFIEHVTDWSTEVPMLVLCTTRPELYERHPNWGGGKRNFTAISLPPLPGGQASSLVTALVSRASLPASDAAIVLERAGGNPLFAEELVRMRRDLAEADASAPPSDARGDEAFPETLQAIIAGRLDTLPPSLKALLQDASVVGRVFWSGAVAAIGGLDQSDAEDRLHELAMRELVRPARVSSVRDELEFSFWHVLIRDVAYNEIPRAGRAEKHLATAAWLEELGGERVADHAEQLAHHYHRGLSFARAAGMRSELAAVEEKTRTYLEMAGDRAMPLEVTRAEEFFRQAIDLTAPGTPERARLLARAAETAASDGRFEEANRDYDDAIGEFRTLGNRVGEGDAMVRLANLLWWRGETERGRMLMQKALELLQAEPPGPELARCFAEIATDRMTAGRLDEVKEWTDRALALAERLGDRALEPRPLSFRGMARCYLGDFDGIADVRAALDVSLEEGLSRDSARAHAMLTELLWASEGTAAALETSRAGAALADHRGITDMTASCRCSGVGPLFELGRWDEMLSLADEVVEWSLGRGLGYIAVMAEPWTAQVFAMRGDVERAASLAAGFLPAAREIGEAQVFVPALVSAALTLVARGDADAAASLVEELEESASEVEWYRAHHLTDLVRVCLAAGRGGLASSLVNGTAETAARRRLSVRTSRALLAEADGSFAEAAATFEDAAAGWEAYGNVVEQGLALLGAGRCLQPSDASRAGSLLTRARAVFEGLGAEGLVEETSVESTLPT
jgi:class 3 adenylate cyclase/tetratricopeptide (TPR) repeat protein